MAKKATALYLENPEQYTGYSNVKTGKILAIIGIILSFLYLIYVIWIFATIGSDGMMNMNQEWMDKMGM